MSYFRIIIPNNNSEPWIEYGLKSIFKQTCTDWHLVIVDDASVDNSPAIIEKYVGLYPITFVRLHEKKGFPGDVRNIAMKYATDTEYTIFMDSDDWFVNDTAFADVKAKAEETHADVIRMPFQIYESQYRVTPCPLTDSSVEEFVASPYIAPWTKAVKTSKLTKFPEQLIYDDILEHLTLADEIDTVTYIDTYCISWNRQQSNYNSVTVDINSTEWKKRKYHASLFRLYADCIFTEFKRDFVQTRADGWGEFARNMIKNENLL
jgi:glycosyltransferase involved in cell wall biosynthesis